MRADASLPIGHGHVTRCLTLATLLRERGASVSFVSRAHEGHLWDMIEACGFTVDRLPIAAGIARSAGDPAHAASLGASWREDAERTRFAIDARGISPDWIVVDHYALDWQWESAMRSATGRIIAIDDLADRMHDCDVLLDQNLVGAMESRYVGKVPTDCELLLGPRFAMLQSSYAELHDRVASRTGTIRRILVSFGGVDLENFTGRALGAFLDLERPDIDLDVVIPSRSPHAGAIRRQAAGFGNVHLHESLSTLAPLMASADLGIGAAGTTTWERLCLGLPSVVIALADNQRPVALELQRRGLVQFLGDKEDIDDAAILARLRDLTRTDLPEGWSKACWGVVDGRGAHRIVDCMFAEEPHSSANRKGQ